MNKLKCFSAALLVVALPLATTPAIASGSIHAYFADEHNTTPTTPTGNRVLEIDVDNMTIVNILPVDGLANHHADSGYSSKIYAVPKHSGFINSIELRKDINDQTTMQVTTKIPLIHKPRSGDAYNADLGIILMAASNRPMASLIDTLTDQVVGTIGEDVDCTLTTGGQLLDQPNPNSIANATAYHCNITDAGGTQVSGHPYWLTKNIAAIVDRTNRQISVYKITKDGNGVFHTSLMGHTATKTSIHQIVPRDRSNLPTSQQADFYAIEEGAPNRAKAPALLKLQLTNSGLNLVKRVTLGRRITKSNNDYYAAWIDDTCTDMLNSALYYGGSDSVAYYMNYYLDFYLPYLGVRGGTYQSQDIANNKIHMPAECIDPSTQGGHNADFALDNQHLYIGSKEGHVFIVDVNAMMIRNIVDTGVGYGNGAGSGHTTFIPGKNIGIVTNHLAPYMTAIDTATFEKIKDIPLNFARENIFSAVQSHTGFVSEDAQYYYNFWTDGGVYFKIDTDTLNVVDSLYTGGIPIQGSYIHLDSLAPVANPPVCLIGADPQVIDEGDGTAVWWFSENAASATVTNVGAVGADSFEWLSPAVTTTYTHDIVGLNGATASCETTVVVNPVASSTDCQIGADPQIINAGDGTAVWWYWDNNAQSATVTNVGTVAPDSFKWISPTDTTTYTLDIVEPDGSVTSCATTVIVNPSVPAPDCVMGADPQTIQTGEGTAVWWKTFNAASATITNIGAVDEDNFSWISPTETTTYILDVQGDDGTITSCETTVTVQ